MASSLSVRKIITGARVNQKGGEKRIVYEIVLPDYSARKKEISIFRNGFPAKNSCRESDSSGTVMLTHRTQILYNFKAAI